MTQAPTRLRFTKMQGAGNDFVVLDTTREPLSRQAGLLTPELIRRLGDRRFGVGADQILVVAPPPAGDESVDFSYRIFNNTGDEVEHCGNGARCFARYVRDHGLTQRDRIRVATVNNRLELQVQPDGRVTVDMNVPRFEPASLPFDASGLVPRAVGGYQLWPLAFDAGDGVALHAPVEVAIASMGNPHAVLRVDDVDTAPVGSLGPLIEHHARFPRRVNAGFLQVVSRSHVRLRVFERDAGETLACGTGACAAVACGIRLGWLDPRVDVDARGGRLTIEWAGGPDDRVWMTGPATTVYEGEFAL